MGRQKIRELKETLVYVTMITLTIIVTTGIVCLLDDVLIMLGY